MLFFLFIRLFVRDNAAHIITYIVVIGKAITKCVNVLHKRFLASRLICNPSPWSGLSKKNIFLKHSTHCTIMYQIHYKN